MFKGHVTDNNTHFPVGDHIVVKFTSHYSLDAHRICCGFNRRAPRILAMEELPGGGRMVVMEIITGRFFDPANENPVVEGKLRSVIQHLHDDDLK